MKNIIVRLSYILSLVGVIWACDSEDDLVEDRIAENTIDVSFTPGNADFTNYIALGNSLTAGFMDGALYTEGQDNSFPNIIGTQLIEAGLTADFNQPDINAENGFNATLNTDPTMATFGKFILDTSIPGPTPTMPGDPITPFAGDRSTLNNFGVSGAGLADLTNPAVGLPTANPFYARFATNPGVSTILSDALATDPTFFTLWAGSADVLGYATSGGTGEDPLDEYSQMEFTTDFSNVIGQLVAEGAEGVVINIPPVTLIPFLRAVPYNPVPLDEATAGVLNTSFAGFNGALDAIVANLGHDADDANARKIAFAAAPNNPLLIIDEALEDLSAKFDQLEGAGAISADQRAALQPFVQARQATGNDLIPLSTQPSIGEDLNPMEPGTALRGISVPLSDEFVLTFAESVAAVTAAATYNGVISTIVDNTPGVELFDIQPIFADIAGLEEDEAIVLGLTPAAQAAADDEQGIFYEGVLLLPDFSPTGIFSTDGIHPNPRGHAIVANELIDVINSSFGSNIPRVNSTIFRTVLFQ